MHHSLVAGVDIGGSHITVALVDARTKQLLRHTIRRKMIDSSGSADAIIKAWCAEISASHLICNARMLRVGLAMPGPFDYENGISLMKEQGKFTELYGINIKEKLSTILNVPAQSIVFENDAACFLEGEMFQSATAYKKPVLGITLGTGLGSSRSHHGITEDADLWNHPFRDGIAEDYLSGRWFERRYQEVSGSAAIGAKQLAQQANEGDPLAVQVFHEFGETLAEFLTPIIRAESIETVIIGGNISNAYALFSSSLRSKLEQSELYIRLMPSALGEHSALIGAASYCIRKSGTTSRFSSVPH